MCSDEQLSSVLKKGGHERQVVSSEDEEDGTYLEDYVTRFVLFGLCLGIVLLVFE